MVCLPRMRFIIRLCHDVIQLHSKMGNTFRNTVIKINNQDKSNFPTNDSPDPNKIPVPASMNSKPIIFIPSDTDVHRSEGKRIKFTVRHATTDFPAIVDAHEDLRISTLKQYLIQYMGIPLPREDGRCKILMVWNKPDLLRDEALKVATEDQFEMDERYLGGSIDHLRLSEYGLESGDFLMFTVMFPQILKASTNSFK